MKKFLASLSIILALGSVCRADVWPDGSKMDRWFTSKGEKVSGKQARRFVLTDYGVVKDSTILQTEAIQKVIDLAAEQGGGTVVVPEGVYLTSSLFFKSGTHLYLEKGSVLKGSDDVSDYAIVPVHIEGVIQPYIAALVNAYDVDGFSVRGEGVIDGNGLRYWRDFWTRRKVNPKCTNLEALRPRLFYAAGSNNVTLEGVTLRNPGFWTTHFYKCDHVRIKDIVIFAPKSPIPAPSSDGVDVDACNNVHISGCRFQNSDDLIAIKGGKGPWADTDPDNGTNSNILIEDCWFGPGSAMVTFGSECVGGRNIILRNCVGAGSSRVLWLKMRPDTPQKYEYILVENITGTVGNFFYVHPWTQFFDLKGREDIPMSYGEHITMRNCSVTCTRKAIDIVENPEQYLLSDIVYENLTLTETEEAKAQQARPQHKGGASHEWSGGPENKNR